MPKGFKHSTETKKIISHHAKGKGKGGFNVKIHCPHCNQEMSPANLGKHELICKNSRGLFLNEKELSVKEIKVLKRRLKPYNITVNQYIEIHNKQNGKCEICNSKSYRERLSVDHCHKTSKFRGLICDRCNMAIGLLDDNILLLEQIVSYLNSKNN